MTDFKQIVIFDLDGTLFDTSHRDHLISADKGSGERKWKEFFEASVDDSVFNHVAQLNFLLAMDGNEIFLVTSRPSNYRKQTLQALNKSAIMWDQLLMRDEEDRREDTVVKRELYEKYIKPLNKPILCVFEDRLPVCEMWRKLGLNVVVCGDAWRKNDWSK